MNLPCMNVIMPRVMYVRCVQARTHSRAEKRACRNAMAREPGCVVLLWGRFFCLLGSRFCLSLFFFSLFLPPSLSFSLSLAHSLSPSLSLSSFLPFVLHFCSFIRCISPPSLPSRLLSRLLSFLLTLTLSPSFSLSPSLSRGFLRPAGKMHLRGRRSWPLVDARQLSAALMIQKRTPAGRGRTSSGRGEKRLANYAAFLARGECTIRNPG